MQPVSRWTLPSACKELNHTRRLMSSLTAWARRILFRVVGFKVDSAFLKRTRIATDAADDHGCAHEETRRYRDDKTGQKSDPRKSI